MESTRDTIVEIIDGIDEREQEISAIKRDQESDRSLKCRVCGREPASNNYGSLTCTSCKVFFLRATTPGTRWQREDIDNSNFELKYLVLSCPIHIVFIPIDREKLCASNVIKNIEIGQPNTKIFELKVGLSMSSPCQRVPDVVARRKNSKLVHSSCKVFFLRATTSGTRSAECQNRQLCEKQDFRGKGRSKCIPCRYTKCIEVGMIPEITARRQGCKLREKRANVGLRLKKNERILEKVESDEFFTRVTPSPDSRELQLVAKIFKAPIILPIADDVKTIWDLKGLVELERFLQNDQPCTSVTFDFKYKLNCSMRDVLNNPTTICARVPVGFHLSTNHQVPEELRQSMGGRTFARSLVLISDWIRSIPEFWELDEVDRVNLCCQQYLRQIIFTDFYYTYKYNYQGFLVLLGTRVSKNDLLLYKDLANSMGFLIEFGLSTIIPSMKRADICDEEFVLLKNIILFSSNLTGYGLYTIQNQARDSFASNRFRIEQEIPLHPNDSKSNKRLTRSASHWETKQEQHSISAIGFTDRSVTVMRKAFSKYCSMLFQYQKTKFGDEIVIEKFTEAMAHPSYLQSINQKMCAQLGKAVLCKEAGLFGKLPEELFCKS